MQDQCNKLNFKGQFIFIGLDVARKSWKTCILTQNLEHKTFTQPPHSEMLVCYLYRNFPGGEYFSVYEAGFILMGWDLVRLRIWPTVFGATLVTVAQLRGIDRMGLLYEEMERTGSVEMDG